MTGERDLHKPASNSAHSLCSLRWGACLQSGGSHSALVPASVQWSVPLFDLDQSVRREDCYHSSMEGLDLDLKVTAYGQSTTHWWALSVPTHPVEAISSAPTTSLSDTIHRDDIAAQSVSTYPVFDGGKYVLSAKRPYSVPLASYLAKFLAHSGISCVRFSIN